MPKIEVVLTINIDEEEYKKAIAENFQKYYGEPMEPSEIIDLDDLDDFLRALPSLYLDDNNTTLEVY